MKELNAARDTGTLITRVLRTLFSKRKLRVSGQIGFEEFENFADPFEWWEKAKLSFKRIAIRRATIIGKIRRHERFVLQSRLDKLQERAKNGTTRDIEQYLIGGLEAVRT